MSNNDFYSVGEFLARYDKPTTKTPYSNALNLFLEYLGETKNTFNFANYIQKGKRRVENDVFLFVKYLKNKDLSPKTVHGYYSAVKSYFSLNEFELSKKTRDDITRIKGKPIPKTRDTPIKDEDLIKLFNAMDYVGTTFFHVMASTGARIQEVNNLTFDDVELDFSFEDIDVISGEKKRIPLVRIHFEDTKGGYPREAFLTREAEEQLRSWIKTGRDAYLSQKYRNKNLARWQKSKGFKLGKDSEFYDKVFPFKPRVPSEELRKAMEITGLKKRHTRSNRYTIHSHLFRKRFITKMGVINKQYTNSIVGQQGYLDQEYELFDNVIPKWFYQNMDEIMVHNNSVNFQAFKKKTEKRFEKIQEDNEIKTQQLKELELFIKYGGNQHGSFDVNWENFGVKGTHILELEGEPRELVRKIFG